MVMAAVVGGGALLTAGATAVASHNNSSAIKDSTQAQTQAQNDALQAEIAANDKALAAQQSAFNSSGQTATDIHNQNISILQPWAARGNDAGNRINAILGLPEQAGYTPTPISFTPVGTPTPTPAITPAATPAGDPNGNIFEQYQAKVAARNAITAPSSAIPAYAFGTPPGGHRGGPALVGENGPEVVNLPPGAQVIPNAMTSHFGGHHAGFGNPNAIASPTPAPATQTPSPTPTPPPSPQQQAINTFYDTPLYQFPLQQGLNAINSQYAARGQLQSGAAEKAIEQYASGVAGGALGNYLGLLGNQQGVGFSAASAQTGVGQNYANSITGLGSQYAANVGNLAGNLANAQSNYANGIGNINANAINANANNTNATIGGIGSALGGIGGYYAYQNYNPYSALAGPVSANIAANSSIF